MNLLDDDTKQCEEQASEMKTRGAISLVSAVLKLVLTFQRAFPRRVRARALSGCSQLTFSDVIKEAVLLFPTANLKSSREAFDWSTKGFMSTHRPEDQLCGNRPTETPEACGRESVFVSCWLWEEEDDI